MAKGTKLKNNGLTIQQDKFAILLAEGMSQAEAYRKAFPISKKWKDSSVYSKSSHLAAQDKVKERVSALREEVAAKSVVTVQMIEKELARIGFSDIRKLFDEDGELRNPKDLDDDAAAALASMEVDVMREEGRVVGHTKKVKQYDKIAALRLLGQYKGMFKEPEQQGVKALFVFNIG